MLLRVVNIAERGSQISIILAARDMMFFNLGRHTHYADLPLSGLSIAFSFR